MNRGLKSTTFIVLFFFITLPVFGQQVPDKQQTFTPNERPKLVVGIVVDQMRYEYIPRFWDKFADGGFRRLIDGGYLFSNHHFNYFPTYTGPGHAAIYTGTTPSVNGIVGNNWYNRESGEEMYVVADSTVKTIGGKATPRSPANLLSTTVTDELKQSIPGSKVIAVSIKDRGAVLPAGHLGDVAFWYDDQTGHFVTSTWYTESMPKWMEMFNEKNLAGQYSTQTWEPLLDLSQYGENISDDSPYEEAFPGEENPVFPHEMDSSLSRITDSPFGNQLVAEAAKAAVDGAQLGEDDATDFLAVGFSSTDYVGHQFGPYSIELQDTYLRLDRDITDLLNFLDEKVGKGEYVVFLTSDHGVVDIPTLLQDKGLPGGLFNSSMAIDSLRSFLTASFGDEDWIESYANKQVYLDRNLIREQDLSLEILQHETARFLRRFEGVASTNTAYNFETEGYSTGVQAMYQRGHYPRRSGDVYIQLAPGWLDRTSELGTSHGSPYSYDTHVPLIFYGGIIPQGRSSEKTVIPQIAPTISNLLQIEFPNGSDSNVLKFE